MSVLSFNWIMSATVGADIIEKKQKTDKRRRKISVVKLLTASTEIAIKERRQSFLWFLVWF